MNVATEPAPRAFGPNAWDDTIPAHYEACVTPVLTLEEAESHPLFAGGLAVQPWREVPSGG